MENIALEKYQADSCRATVHDKYPAEAWPVGAMIGECEPAVQGMLACKSDAEGQCPTRGCPGLDRIQRIDGLIGYQTDDGADERPLPG